MSATPKPACSYLERNRRTGQARRRRMRSRLIEAALKVISEHGIEAPVIDDFIVAANVSRGSFYNYFNTKEELLHAVSDTLQSGIQYFHEEALKLIEDPAERLAWGIRQIVRRAASDPQMGSLLISETRKFTSLDLLLRRAPARDIRSCMASGRLPQQNIEVAIDFLIGAVREAARAAASQRRPRAHPEDTAHLVLRGLGMESTQALELSRRPLQDSTASGASRRLAP